MVGKFVSLEIVMHAHPWAPFVERKEKWNDDLTIHKEKNPIFFYIWLV